MQRRGWSLTEALVKGCGRKIFLYTRFSVYTTLQSPALLLVVDSKANDIFVPLSKLTTENLAQYPIDSYPTK